MISVNILTSVMSHMGPIKPRERDSKACWRVLREFNFFCSVCCNYYGPGCQLWSNLNEGINFRQFSLLAVFLFQCVPIRLCRGPTLGSYLNDNELCLFLYLVQSFDPPHHLPHISWLRPGPCQIVSQFRQHL